MKNLAIKSLLIICIALVFNACKSPTYIYENSGHAIDMETSNILYKNYNDNIKPTVEERQKAIVQRETYEGTEYVLVSIQQLENYIKFLKHVEKQNTTKDGSNKITGIAIFLGAHDKSKTLKSIPEFNHKINNIDKMNKPNDRLIGDMRHRMTTFFAPTFRDDRAKGFDSISYDSEFKRHVPFYIEYTSPENVYKGRYEYLIPYLRENLIDTNEASRTTGGKQSLNLDEFNTMPPKT